MSGPDDPVWAGLRPGDCAVWSWIDEQPGRTYEQAQSAVPEPPEVVPDDWRPRDDAPAWRFTTKDDPKGVKVWVCEERPSATADLSC